MEKRNKRIVIIAAVLIAVVTAAIIGIMAIQATPANRLKASLRLAEKYYSEMNYEQAIIAYKEAIAIDPKCEAAYLAIADIYTAQGQDQEAVRVLEEAANIIQTDAIKVKLEEARKQADAVKRAQQNNNGQQGTRPSAEKPTESPTKPAEEPTLHETQPAQTETQAPTAVQAGTRLAETQPPTESLTQPATKQETQASVPAVTEIPTLPAAETAADVTSGDDTGNDNGDSDDSDTSDNGRGDEDVTEAPTQKPTEAPTQKPTEKPTQKPTEAPTTPTAPSVSDIKNANTGDIVTFGTYEQDNNLDNGAEPIEWQVLDKKNGKLLVISRYGLDCQPYDETNADVTWEICTLRSWLNSKFYNTAFNDSEKASIRTTTLSNHDNATYGTSGGNETQDNVFCLSIDEAKVYFGTDDSNGYNPARATKPTAYAVARGTWTNCWWWLRSPGCRQWAAAYVDYTGYIDEDGGYGACVTSAVRPAMWIDPSQTEAPTTPTAPSISDIKNANTGDIVTFGTYEQDNNTANGAEAIEWQVLDKKEGKLLVISCYGLDCQQYNEARADVTWETCTLRSWLNSEFYNTAFNDSEKALIRTTTLDNPDNAGYGTSGGNATDDNVFCLSIDEATAYFGADDSNGNNPSRSTKPTAYAVARGARAYSSTQWYGGNCWWWLRSPGYGRNNAAIVDSFGSVVENGYGVTYDSSAVRPALWIDTVQTEAPTTPTSPSVSDIENANVGDIVTFGTYEQDNNTANGAEAIEWQVLDKKEGKLLVISRYGLDCHIYNETGTSVTWERSSLRSWLNSEFYNTAFNESEKASIRTTTISNPDNADYGISGGNETQDNVFCLSIDEAKAYFGADSKDSDGNTINKARATKPTAYAVARGAWTSTSTEWHGGNCWWWLRSPGNSQYYAANVGGNGDVDLHSAGTYAVRPALWIDPAQTETPTTTTAPSVSDDIKNANIGDIVTFGTYEQDNNTANGAEAIEWQVLDKKDGKLLVISRYGLDSQPYNETQTSVTWETCNLRSWLNSEFYNTAFSNSEKALIRTTTLDNPDSAAYGTSGGNATNDNGL